MRAADAVFDAEFAAAYGVEYTEDLFAQANEDSRTTTNVDGFLAAQHAWVEANLPPNGVVLQSSEHGGASLPPKAQRYYGKPGKGGERVGYHVNERTGQVDTVLFTVSSSAKAAGKGRGAADEPVLPKTPRPALTQKGTAMIGDMRTDALHAALRDEPIDSPTLIALLVLALAGNNVEVKTGLTEALSRRDTRHGIAATLTEGGAITSDHDVLQAAARSMLAYTLSCRDNWSGSGAVACLAGDAVGADAHLPNMATPDFLSCLSKAAVEGVAIGLNVPVQPTGKATRGAVIARVGEGRWIYPSAVFASHKATAAPTGRDQDQAEDDMLGEQGSEPLPDEETGIDRTDEAEEDADLAPDELDGDAPPPAVEDEDQTADAAQPAPPARRRRSRKDNGEAHAAT